MMQKIVISPVSLPSPSELYFGEDLLRGPLLVDLCQRFQGKIVIIVDARLKVLYGEPLAKKLNASLLTIPGGEMSKTRKIQKYLEDALFKMGCGRDTLLIALGGGVTTDLVGFVASTYLRGVSLILIPTTLVGMVDASIGGKTGINTSFGKNLIGTTYFPKAIVADVSLLNTLPQKERDCGLAEILKLGLVYDSSLWMLSKLRGVEMILRSKRGGAAPYFKFWTYNRSRS